MKNFFLFSLILFLLTSNSYSVTLSEGETFSGSLKNLYGQGINITLPDGSWEVTSSEKDQWYTDIELYSEKYNTWAYISSPVAPTTGDFWGGSPLKKCNGSNVFLSLIERSAPESTLCFEDKEYEGDLWGVVTLNTRTSRPPLKWLTVTFWTPIENVKTSLSNQKIKEIGKSVFKALRVGFKGGSSNEMALLSEFMINDNFSNSMSNLSEEDDASSSVSEKLTDLKQLLDQGLISQDQYDEKSSELLENL